MNLAAQRLSDRRHDLIIVRIEQTRLSHERGGAIAQRLGPVRPGGGAAATRVPPPRREFTIPATSSSRYVRATKESLVLDQLEITMSALRTGLADFSVPPAQAALHILDTQLTAMTAGIAASSNPDSAIAGYGRFSELIGSTPSLRAYQSDTMDRFVAVAAELLAERVGLRPDDPEPLIAAVALLGLWRLQFQSLRRHLATTPDPAKLHNKVTIDVHRAARLIENGLTSSWHRDL